MTQEEFNEMLAIAIAQNLGGGYYTSQYSGEEIDTLLGLTSYAAGSTVIADLTTDVNAAKNAAVGAANMAAQAAQSANRKATEAANSATAAAASASSIENMTATVTALPFGDDPTVTKTVSQGVVNLNFGLPTGEVYSYVDDGNGNITIEEG